MKKITAKKIYEKIVLHGHTPTPEESDVLEGTHWKHKLHGTVPEKTNVYRNNFKTFFEQEVPSNEHQSRSELADSIVDKVEDKFGLHFSDMSVNPVDHTKLPEIKSFIHKHLSKCRAATGDIKAIAVVVNKAEDIHELMVRLNIMTS
jgi:hypothetical protein